MAGRAPYDVLFDPQRVDSSIWHGRPRGLHAFGLLAPPASRDVQTVREATDTSDSADDRTGRTHRPPALAHGTIQAILADAIMVWLEGAGLSRESFHRVEWRWWPTHVRGTWQAKGVEIVLQAALAGDEAAVIDVQVRNTAAAPLEADLVLCGDDNYITLCRSGAHRLEGQWTFAGDRAVVVTKHPQWAQEMEYFPYTSLLPDDDPKFEYLPSHYQIAFAFDEGPWQRERQAGTDGFETWRLHQPLRVEPGRMWRMQVGFAGRWHGRREADASAELVAAAEAAQREPLKKVLTASRRMWRRLLAKAPVLEKDWPAEWVALYYKAWVTVWADLLPPADLVLFTSKRPIVTCLRIGDTMFSNPASWEAALGALVLSLADPKLGCRCIEAIYDTTAEDGYIAEALGARRGTALACVEPWIAWACYRQSGDKKFLARIWDRLRKNLIYRLHFPWFKHGTVFSCRNYAYGNISARAAMKIARQIHRPAEEIAQVQQMIDETDRIVHAFWDEAGGYHRASFDANERAGGPAKAFADGTDAATMVALLGVARPNERKRMIEFLRREYVADSGLMRRYPVRAATATSGHKHHLASMGDFAVKESNHMAILKGIKDADRDLFETVARGTVANIAADGDFWECMTADGRGRHNGPGSIFGAFAVIWALLLMEDKVDSLYD